VWKWLGPGLPRTATRANAKGPKSVGGESRYTTYARVKLLRGRKETRELSTGQITQRAEELSFPARPDPNDLTPSAVHLRSRAPTHPLSVSSFARSLSLSLSSSSTVVGIHSHFTIVLCWRPNVLLLLHCDSLAE
jgi:hypothetical protein